MSNIRFDMIGASRSYLDLYLGLGWSVSVYLLLQSALLWQMAALARINVAPIRPIIAIFMLSTLTLGIISWWYISALPALFCGALIIALSTAYWSARGASVVTEQ